DLETQGTGVTILAFRTLFLAMGPTPDPVSNLRHTLVRHIGQAFVVALDAQIRIMRLIGVERLDAEHIVEISAEIDGFRHNGLRCHALRLALAPEPSCPGSFRAG